MDVVLTMFSNADGSTFLSTRKLERFIIASELCCFSSLLRNRPPPYRPVLDYVIVNDFVSTDFERYMGLIEDLVSTHTVNFLNLNLYYVSRENATRSRGQTSLISR